MVIDGLMGYLNNLDQFEIKGHASNGVNALEALKPIEVDVVLTDIQMPAMDGIELTRQLIAKNPNQKVLALTMFNEPMFIKKMLQVGALGYVLKNAGKAEIVSAVTQVAQGHQYYSPEVTEVVMNHLRGAPGKGATGVSVPITEREREILYLILQQNSNKEIAEKLFISARTVEAHKRNLIEKTGSKNIAGLVLFAIENQLFKDF